MSYSESCVWVLLFLVLLNENFWVLVLGLLFWVFFLKKKPSNPEGSIFISVNINDYYSMIIAMILKTKHILWCGCVWVFWCPNMYWPTSVAPSRCVSHL